MMRKINAAVMTLAGLLLIAAAGLKFHEMLTICVPSWQSNKLGFWESYEFLLIQIPLELALGVWMVCGLFRKAAWIAGTLAYLGFIAVTLVKALTGAASCGCFGQIHVNPWITLFSIDIPFFVLLAVFRPAGAKLLPPPWPNVFYLLAVAVPTLGLMALAAPVMVMFRPACIKADDVQPDMTAPLRLQLHQANQMLAAKDEQLKGLSSQIAALHLQIEQLRQAAAAQTVPQPVPPDKTGPLTQQPIQSQPDDSQTRPPANSQPARPASQQWEWMPYIVEETVRKELAEGIAVVLMYHYDCPTCAQMVPLYSAYCKQMTEQGNEAFKIAFLAVPPYGQGPVPADTTCLQGTLTDQQKWELTSPYVVALLDGQIVKTWPQGTAPAPDKILDDIFGR
ncbi:MAG TPA: hypothetical protein PKW71_12305 [Anaerohalosphaeraceae bacterium]|nr:hypothetical protein [Anaerohalosphaeraceae bacterium]